MLHNDVKRGTNEILSTNSIDTPINTIWNNLKTCLLNAQELHVPSRITSARFSQPWITRECKRLIRIKKRRYKRFKLTKRMSDWEKYQQAARNSKKACASAYNSFIRHSTEDNNKKKLFSVIKSKRTEIIGVAPLKNNGTTYTNDADIARILNEQFTSVFSEDDGSVPTSLGQPVNVITDDLIITKNGVIKLLNKINTNTAGGPDDVSARILKTCANDIADVLVLLFNASLKQEKIPIDWKHALITPVYKGANKDRSKAESYRPISLTSIVCKTLEHIIHSHIINHLESKGVLTNCQHGFRKNRSCETQLIETVNSLTKSLNDRKQVDSILLDFSKAFDKVCHRKLLLKLKNYGIPAKLLNWIDNFLNDRTQSVVVRGVQSERSIVKSGVPQGTVLGPLLFLVYINDMPERVKSSILALFADDSYLHKEIETVNDAIALQDDLDDLTKWENEWSAEFHPDKCKMLRVTNKRKTINHKYHIHGHELENVSEAKYLGVTLTNNMSWKSHIQKIASKANNCRLFLQRNLRKCSAETKLRCYTTYVRPILEYAASVWDPVDNKLLTDILEKVQRKAVRWISNDWQHLSSPTEMMESLSLSTLFQRRQASKMKMLYGINNGTKFVSQPPARQRCRDVRYKPLYSSIKAYTNSFYPSAIATWNKLPRVLVNLDNENDFKRGILDIMF